MVRWRRRQPSERAAQTAEACKKGCERKREKCIERRGADGGTAEED
jgi:hypothetical protein